MRRLLNVLFLPTAALLLASCGGGNKPGEPKDSLGIGVSVTTTDEADDDAKDTLVLAPNPPAAGDTAGVTTTSETREPGATATPPATSTTTTTPSSPGKTTTTTTETRSTTTPPVASTTTKPPASTPPATRTPEPTPPPARTPDPTPPPAATPPATAGADGGALFSSLKCTTCHNVSSEGIAGGKVKDLSGVGSRHPKSWIVGYLQKKETLDGKPHKKSWSGTDAELEVIATWLAGLR